MNEQNITTTADNDLISGENLENTLVDGLDGNDTINGTTGNDTLLGGNGDDFLDGDTGDDSLDGGDGNDTLFGGSRNSGNDLLVGGNGDDFLDGGAGEDTLDGGDGNDTLDNFLGSNLLLGGEGNDTLNGGNLDDSLYGGGGDDSLNGDAGNDLLVGNYGNDILIGGFGSTGNDTIVGGRDSDTLTGSGSRVDTFFYSLDPFEGQDVSAPGRQIIGEEDFITNFELKVDVQFEEFSEDVYRFNATDFNVFGDVNFTAVDANAPDASIAPGTNVVTLLNSDNDNNPDTPFVADTAADQIAELTSEDGAGFFVYYNSELQLQRLVYSTNLNDTSADLKIISRQTNRIGQLAIDTLEDFSAVNFEFEDIQFVDDGENKEDINGSVLDENNGEELISPVGNVQPVVSVIELDEVVDSGAGIEGSDAQLDNLSINNLADSNADNLVPNEVMEMSLI